MYFLSVGIVFRVPCSSFPPLRRNSLCYCEGTRRAICQEFYERIVRLENEKYDLERVVALREHKVHVHCDLSVCVLYTATELHAAHVQVVL
jgi:hypothetical protein